MNLLLGILVLGMVAFQWFSQEVSLKVSMWRIGFHRDEWPAFFWITLLLEFGLGAAFIYWFFA